MAIVLALSACSSPIGTTGTGDGSAITASVAATGSALSVPVTTTAEGTSSMVVVQISVGGGDPVPVMLDTGSSGLVVDAAAVGAEASRTGGPITQNYASGPVSGTLGTAIVEIGGAVTPQPIAVAMVDVSGSGDAFPDGTRGIMGVSTTDSDSTDGQQIFSPNLQLGAPYNAGSTLTVGTTSGSTGTWSLGPVQPPAGATSVPLVPLSSGSVPDGYPAFSKDVSLCWTIGTQAATCQPTDLDTGMSHTALNATTYSSYGPVHTFVPAGQPVSVAPPNGAPLWSFTTGAKDSSTGVELSSLGSDTQFNTGVPFYYGRTIAWNYSSGQLLIGPVS